MAEAGVVPGALTIADRVGIKIAERAALGVDKVVPYTSGVGKLTGNGGAPMIGSAYPRAEIDMTAHAPRLSVEVALTWPSRITEVCQTLRTQLADELERLTGVRPAAVDVSVVQLLPRAEANRVARGLIELPTPAEPDPGDEDLTA